MSKLFVLLAIYACSSLALYPKVWWEPVAEETKQWWEILPQEADQAKSEVILSKRNELGIFSNFGRAPFIFENEHYASIEGLWQMMKYPEPKEPRDPRNQWKYPYTRDEVKLMDGFKAKEAGDLADKINKDHGLHWISYKGNRFNHKDHQKGSNYHYDLIYRATQEKINQNPKVKKLLLKTKGLSLLPDHHQEKTDPPAWRYYKILMKIRDGE